MNQRDIVLIPYPFSDYQGTKVRPAIIISNDTLNSKSEDCILAPITTVIKSEPYSIIISNQDLQSGHLVKESRVRVDKLLAVKKSIILKRIGILSLLKFKDIKTELGNLF